MSLVNLRAPRVSAALVSVEHVRAGVCVSVRGHRIVRGAVVTDPSINVQGNFITPATHVAYVNVTMNDQITSLRQLQMLPIDSVVLDVRLEIAYQLDDGPGHGAWFVAGQNPDYLTADELWAKGPLRLLYRGRGFTGSSVPAVTK